MILSLLIACQPDEPVPEGEEPYEPVPYLVEEEDPPEPSFSAEALSDAIDQGLQRAIGITGVPIFPAYEAVMATADEACPTYYAYGSNVYWYDYCWSEQGTLFNGYSFHLVYDQYDGGDGLIYTGDQLYGIAQVTTADGEVFEAGGTAYDLYAESADYQVYYSVVQGGFSWTGAGDSWLAEGLAPNLYMVAYYVPAMDGRAFSLEGGVAGLEGDFDTVVFDGLVLYDEKVGGACPIEPAGMVSVRDPEGQWYDVLFDGEAEYGQGVLDPDACDGCGEAWYRGVSVGQVCAEWSWLNEWEGAPW